jgi:hypothetical protein
MKDGLNTFCIECHKADNIARKIINRANLEFVEKELEYKEKYRAKTIPQRKLYMKEWHKKHSFEQIIYRKIYKENNPNYFINYNKLNKSKLNAKTRARQAAAIQRTPIWVDADEFWMITKVYALAELRTKMLGVNWHVDHIIPLQGKLVSGLHTIANLQVIPAKVNFSKSNKYEVA